VFGKNVIPGIIGSNPEIPASVSYQDNLAMQYDYRSVYAAVLEDWLGANSQQVLGKPYRKAKIVKA
jgi:uncharacterized protein (DUF1501 family)